jgi:hypothetical protein
MYSVTRNDVKQLAAQIEVLAKKVQDELDGTGDFLAPANELIRNSTTMVFALGEVYATEQGGKRVRTKLVNTNRVYKRDSRGRFAGK